ncbi:hypothetical protein [Synechococcus sp. BS55D]|uniref:hypothetical protein n=1 Tax=Synechococcus sp. BS55D TaxID=2055943 RepID=UPI00103DFD47|nr:hypothetical protein [Synechococcus sp. BS55D]TCD56951.1 hypothetical protein CWE16_03805 [Synechococcus sp. BS55D]
MRHLFLPLTLSVALIGVVPALRAQQSSLLESVKRNPQEAQALCNQFKALNAQGVSATSPQAINNLAKQRGLTRQDAEILATYVIGLYCPDVR